MKSPILALLTGAAVFMAAGLCQAADLDGTLWLKKNNPDGTRTYKGFYDGHLYTATGPDNQHESWTKLAYPYLEAAAQSGAYNFMSYADRRSLPLFNRGTDLSSICYLGVCDPDNGSATVCTIEEDHHILLGTIRRTSCAQYLLQQTDWAPGEPDRTSRYVALPSATIGGQDFTCICDYPPGTFVWYFDFSGEVYEKAKKPDNGTYEQTDVLAGTWSRMGDVLTVTFNDSYRAENNISLLTGGRPVKVLFGLFKILQITGFTYDRGEPFYCGCTRIPNYEKYLNKP